MFQNKVPKYIPEILKNYQKSSKIHENKRKCQDVAILRFYNIDRIYRLKRLNFQGHTVKFTIMAENKRS